MAMRIKENRLFEACESGSIKKVEKQFTKHKFLRSPNINSTNGLGETPLHIASDKGHTKIVELLIEKGADVGAIDNFAAAVNGTPQDSNENVQGICPYGWHLPSNKEWDEMISFISNNGHKDSVAVVMKSKEGWRGNKGMDVYGFCALPAGLRASTRDGTFIYRNSLGIWWTNGYCEGDYDINGFIITERMPCNRAIFFERNDVFSTGGLGLGGLNAGNSIRCIKD